MLQPSYQVALKLVFFFLESNQIHNQLRAQILVSCNICSYYYIASFISAFESCYPCLRINEIEAASLSTCSQLLS
jgi:hypothetical protein